MGKALNGKNLGKGFSQRKDGRYEARATINGVKIDLYDMSLSKLKKALKQGKMVVAIMGPGHFTSRGHFIVLYSISKDGKKVKVADCGGRARNRYWDIDTVFNESKTCNDAHCPFWAISK